MEQGSLRISFMILSPVFFYFLAHSGVSEFPPVMDGEFNNTQGFIHSGIHEGLVLVWEIFLL